MIKKICKEDIRFLITMVLVTIIGLLFFSAKAYAISIPDSKPTELNSTGIIEINGAVMDARDIWALYEFCK